MDGETSTSCPETSCVARWRSGTKISCRESAACAGATLTVASTAIYPVQVEAWRNRWSLFDQAAQAAGGDASA